MCHGLVLRIRRQVAQDENLMRGFLYRKAARVLSYLRPSYWGDSDHFQGVTG